MTDDWPACEVCGITGDLRPVEITFDKNTTTIYCELCKGLLDAGMLRPETVDGKLRYRQWHMGEWTPGELLPEVAAVRER